MTVLSQIKSDLNYIKQTAPSAVLSIVATSYFFKVATKVSFLSSALFLTMAYCFKRIGNLIIHAILSSISKEQPRWGSTKANMAILEQVSSVLSVGAAFKLANLTRYGITVAGATNAGLALAGVSVTLIILDFFQNLKGD